MWKRHLTATKSFTIYKSKPIDRTGKKNIRNHGITAPSVQYYLPNVVNRGTKRSRASILDRNIGDNVEGFLIKNITEIKEYDIHSIEFKHINTGADYVHIDSNDTNNVFSVSFKTPPNDSKGTPHILEHSVLCGSKLFPVKDPFFNMLKRSLNTFMNAMTASDHTMYPFSTTNETDFANLLSVYLDAVFFPNLHLLDFKQEGHRLELMESNNLNSELKIKVICSCN